MIQIPIAPGPYCARLLGPRAKIPRGSQIDTNMAPFGVWETCKLHQNQAIRRTMQSQANPLCRPRSSFARLRSNAIYIDGRQMHATPYTQTTTFQCNPLPTTALYRTQHAQLRTSATSRGSQAPPNPRDLEHFTWGPGRGSRPACRQSCSICPSPCSNTPTALTGCAASGLANRVD